MSSVGRISVRPAALMKRQSITLAQGDDSVMSNKMNFKRHAQRVTNGESTVKDEVAEVIEEIEHHTNPDVVRVCVPVWNKAVNHRAAALVHAIHVPKPEVGRRTQAVKNRIQVVRAQRKAKALLRQAEQDQVQYAGEDIVVAQANGYR